MTKLLINIDHVATLRNARRETFPDPVHAALLCELAGAEGIVFHLREDRRHINERDVHLLKQTVRGKLDFELCTTQEIVDICCSVKPHLATLVPEKREEVTTEGGLDVIKNKARLKEVIAQLRENEIEVSLFLDPEPHQIEAAANLGIDCVELHTGDFANTKNTKEQLFQAQRLGEAAKLIQEANMHVHAGHGLDYLNYPLFAQYVQPREVSIGFAIIARAVFIGMDAAVKEMQNIIDKG